MCEFCTEHGEGKKWYLLMKNFSDEMLHQELTSVQQEMVGSTTRAEWRKRGLEGLLRKADAVSEREDSESAGETPLENVSEDELLKKSKAIHFGQVLSIEDVEKVLDMVGSITRIPCGCRLKTTGKADKRYCFGFGIDKLGTMGTYPDSSSSLEVLEKDEAKKIFHTYDEEGLIHSIWTRVTPYISGMCNCDHDCLIYRRQIEKRARPGFLRAEYICQTDWEICTGCKSCMSQCQFGAQFYSSSLSKVYIDPARCYGCGVCRVVCPSDAISLIPRERVPEVENLWL